jgi:hypothetical protein
MENDELIDYMYKEVEYFELLNSILKNYPITHTIFPKIEKKDFEIYNKYKNNKK